jgi:hypothetical protein
MNETVVKTKQEIAREKLNSELDKIIINYKRGRIKLEEIDLLIALAKGYLRGEPRSHE